MNKWLSDAQLDGDLSLSLLRGEFDNVESIVVQAKEANRLRNILDVIVHDMQEDFEEWDRIGSDFSSGRAHQAEACIALIRELLEGEK